MDCAIGVRALVEMQRTLRNSKRPFQRVMGTLWVNEMLKRRLASLTDKQIAQLMCDYVWGELTLFSPEAAICDLATQRLFRSERSGFPKLDLTDTRTEPRQCPACGAEMLFNVGIDEPDFFLCVRDRCKHMESIEPQDSGHEDN